VRERVDWALRATGLEELRGCAPLELSGGGQQRLAIAAPWPCGHRCWCSTSRWPASTPGARQVLHTLADLNRRHGVTIVMIEHRLAEASRVPDASY